MTELKLGRYKHFKGNVYTVFAVVTHTETGEEIVCYTDEEGKTWGRPKSMFLENVEKDGRSIPRFEYLDDTEFVCPDCDCVLEDFVIMENTSIKDHARTIMDLVEREIVVVCNKCAEKRLNDTTQQWKKLLP